MECLEHDQVVIHAILRARIRQSPLIFSAADFAARSCGTAQKAIGIQNVGGSAAREGTSITIVVLIGNVLWCAYGNQRLHFAAHSLAVRDWLGARSHMRLEGEEAVETPASDRRGYIESSENDVNESRFYPHILCPTVTCQLHPFTPTTL
jgi:hypothetical protein